MDDKLDLLLRAQQRTNALLTIVAVFMLGMILLAAFPSNGVATLVVIGLIGLGLIQLIVAFAQSVGNP